MLYGYPQNPRTLVVAAADSYNEMLEFSNTLGNLPGSRQTSFMDHLKSEFKDYKKPVFIIPFANDKQLNQWCEGQVELVSPRRCMEIHRAMIEDLVENEEDDRKPLEEMFALKNHDPWDLRSEQEKQAQAQTQMINKKIINQIQKNIIGPSYFGNKTKNKNEENESLHIEDIQKISDTIAISASKVKKTIKEKIETIEDLFDVANEYEVEISDSNELKTLNPNSKIEDLSREHQILVVEIVKDIKIKIIAKRIVEEFRGENYIYAWNDMLSNNPAVGGNYPVFEVQSVTEGVSIIDLHEILVAIDPRLETISNGIFLFKGNRKDCDDILQKYGFKPVSKIKHKKKRQGKISDDVNISPRDFARALAGDGTSTMAITGSWGKNKIAKTVDEYDLENAFEVDMKNLVLNKVNRNHLALPHKVSLQDINIELDIYSVEVKVPQNNILLKSEKKITVISTKDIQHHRRVSNGHIIMGHKNSSSILVKQNNMFVEIKFKHA